MNKLFSVSIVSIIFALFITACAPSIPADVEQKLLEEGESFYNLNHVTSLDSVAKETKVTISGNGTVLPLENSNGVSSAICAVVWVSPYSGQEVGYPFLVFKIGNAWEIQPAIDNDWDKHSCPIKSK